MLPKVMALFFPGGKPGTVWLALRSTTHPCRLGRARKAARRRGRRLEGRPWGNGLEAVTGAKPRNGSGDTESGDQSSSGDERSACGDAHATFGRCGSRWSDRAPRGGMPRRASPLRRPGRSRRPEADRGPRPAVICSLRACLPVRRCSDPRDAPSPLERVSSEKVRTAVRIFSGTTRRACPVRRIIGVSAGWENGAGPGGATGGPAARAAGAGGPGRLAGRCGNAGSRRGAGEGRSQLGRTGPIITSAPRGRARHLAPPCRRWWRSSRGRGSPDRRR